MAIANHAERADAYLHGLLTPEETAAFERQLADDAALRAALEVARRRLALLEAALPPAESAEELVRRTLERIDGEAHRRRRWRRRVYGLMFAPIAASALILALFHTHYANLSASPVNLEVYGQDTLMPGSAGALRVRLVDKSTQAPIAGVPVEVTLGEPGSAHFATLASFTTDSHGNGQPAFRLPDWADGSYPLRVIAKTAKSPEVLTQSVRLKRSAKLMLTSDKPVYQPGQTIHLRALTLMRPDLTPAANVETSFTITDPRGNIIFRRSDRTSRFGITATDCALADELIEGDYRIACRVGDTDSALTVRVEKYVLPKIRLTISTDKTWYQPGQEVRGTLTATYHHGEPAANAEWALEATGAHARLLAKLSGRTDNNGRATFSFRFEDQPGGGAGGAGPGGFGGAPTSETTVAIAAQVRDAAGQAQTERLQRRVDRMPFRLTVIPEGGALIPGVLNMLYVYAQSPDGNPVELNGHVKISGAVDDQDPNKAPQDKTKGASFQTGSLGIAEILLTPSQVQVVLDFDLVGAGGARLIDRQALYPGPVNSGEYLLRTDKAVYTSGDSMRLTAFAAGSGPVFVDILKDDQIIRSDLLDVNEGRGELVIDVPAELFGTLQLCSYRFDASGRPVRKTRTLFVRPAKQLQVQMKQSKPEFRPGERAKLEFTLTDERGRPTPGALSLAMVDEAVFDVRQSLPGLERTFYLLEQKLLAPTATIYPWSPDSNIAGDAQQRALLEQAIFATTASSGEGTKQRFQTVPPPPLHTLTAATFPAKQQAALQQRQVGLNRVSILWTVFGLWATAVLYALMWMNVRWLHMVILHGVALLILGVGSLMLLVYMSLFSSDSKSAKGERANETGDLTQPRSMAPAGPDVPPGAGAGAGFPESKPIRVRERFPETMLWQPQLITDDAGKASLDLEFADSITTWRLSGGAVSADGRLGSLQAGVRVFQPFFVDLNLPVALTRGDEIEIPAVVSNFQPQGQSVELTLTKADWFELIGPDAQKLELKPREVRSASFRIRVKQVGRHELTVMARGAAFGDAIKRTIEVVPDGRRVEQITNGTLARPAVKLDVPANAIPGSAKAIVRIYPSSFSQLVDGLEGIFRLPTGCFEQTSSSLYPNVLALSYLRHFDKRMPHVEATAIGYIHAGYQRLLTFETPDGGFDWYGRAPGKVALTAYGLMEFVDMARVHDVDPALIGRTTQWLMARRNRDGSWDDAQRGVDADATERRLRTTAYVAWAIGHAGTSRSDTATRDFLLKHQPASIKSSYVLALVCNALLASDPKDHAAKPYLAALVERCQKSAEGRVWWSSGTDSTTFYGAGRSADVEATALAVLALLRTESGSPLVRPALAWLVEQRQVGHWGSTQATILALKALMLGTGKADAGPRRIDVAIDGKTIETVEIATDQFEVMKQLDLTSKLRPGVQGLTLTDRAGNSPGFQVEFRYHVPGIAEPEPEGALAIDVKYDRTELATNEAMSVTATITNRSGHPAPMVMLDLPVPAGFRVDAAPFEKLVASGVIDRFEVTPLKVIVYLRSLGGQPLALTYRLLAGAPAKVSVPAPLVWEYYNPDRRGAGKPAVVTVTPAR